VLAIALGVIGHPRDPAAAWPVAARGALPPVGVLYLGPIAEVGIVVGCWRRFARARRRATGPGAATWATSGDLAHLMVRSSEPGRVVLGRLGSRLVATEARHSVLVLGPTQSGKTSALAIPALLEWQGPVVATSVKSDLVRDTATWRERLGRVQVYDPTGVSGRQGASWSPLLGATSWGGARRVAAALCSVARPHGGTVEDGDFWYATAEKLLAPMLFAAAINGLQMSDVVRWVDGGEVDEVLDLLEEAAAPEALLAAEASFRREARQLSSVYTTAETVLAAFSDPAVLAASSRAEICAERLLDGEAHTLYLVAPTHEQARLAPVFVALVREILTAAYACAESRGGELAAPLLVVLDEAANIAPLDDLDALASTAASHGIQLLSVFQDLAQIEARYGRRAATVLNNHRAKVVFPGISDGATLQQMSELIGESEELAQGENLDPDGRRGVSRSWRERRLAPADRLRRLATGEAVLLYGNLPPVQLHQRPFYEDRELRTRTAPLSEPARAKPPEVPGRRRVPAHASRGSRRGRRGARRNGR
jgi:type IV secretion system protein VirD4